MGGNLTSKFLKKPKEPVTSSINIMINEPSEEENELTIKITVIGDYATGKSTFQKFK